MINARDELSKFVFANSYARFNSDEGRRETFDEAIDRMILMHKKKYPGHDTLIECIFLRKR